MLLSGARALQNSLPGMQDQHSSESGACQVCTRARACRVCAACQVLCCNPVVNVSLQHYRDSTWHKGQPWEAVCAHLLRDTAGVATYPGLQHALQRHLLSMHRCRFGFWAHTQHGHQCVSGLLHAFEFLWASGSSSCNPPSSKLTLHGWKAGHGLSLGKKTFLSGPLFSLHMRAVECKSCRVKGYNCNGVCPLLK